MEDNTKLRNTSKAKERHQAFSQVENSVKRSSAKNQGYFKSDVSKLVGPQPLGPSSSVKKFLNEANKIVKIGMEKEYSLLDKDAAIKSSSETIDNLRKNILHLQMEYEKLDQSYQSEISYRSEMVKRMDTTRSILDSAVQFINKLSSSIKQLEDDKLRLAEFYEIIFMGQQEVDEKHRKIEELLRQQDVLLKTKLAEISENQEKAISHNSEEVIQLSEKLSHANDKLKASINENHNLTVQIEEFRRRIESLTKSLQEREKLLDSSQADVKKFKFLLKKFKIQKFKCQRLCKSRQRKISHFKNKNENLQKNLSKLEVSYRELSSVNGDLEISMEAMRKKFEQEMKLKTESLENVMTENETIKKSNLELHQRIIELMENEESRKIELEHLQHNSTELYAENVNLKEKIKVLSEENSQQVKTISELEDKMNNVEHELQSKISLQCDEMIKFEEIIRKMKDQAAEAEEKLSSQRTQTEKLVAEFESKLGEKQMLIDNYKNLLEDKTNKINELEAEIKEKVTSIEVLKTKVENTASKDQEILEKLKQDLEKEKLRNGKLNENLGKEKERNETLRREVEEVKRYISDIEEKFKSAKETNETLKMEKTQLEKYGVALKQETEHERRNSELLMGKCQAFENQLKELQMVAEENLGLKSKVDELKTGLESTEARVEAYKVIVRKLETEIAENKENHIQEISTLTSKLSHNQGNVTKEEEFYKLRMETLDRNPKDQFGKKDTDVIKPRKTGRGKAAESTFPQTPDAKENEPEQGSSAKLIQGSVTPLQSSKKFLLTPRKVLSSTPQRKFPNLTPIKKKKDPYEFDSDSSVERYDPDQVLKVYNQSQGQGQKRDMSKRPKTTK